jgi:hypothetical protein
MAALRHNRQSDALRTAGKQGEGRKAASEAPWGGSHLFEREVFDFSEVDTALLADGIAYTLKQGNALTLSLTSDGGAVKFTLWQGGSKHVAYAASASQFDTLTSALGEPLTDAAKGA